MAQEFIQESSSIGQGDSCPHMGFEIDQSICYSYPHERNLCYRVSRPESINLSHQNIYCLTTKYNTCVIFNSLDITQLPNEIKAVKVPSPKKLLFKRSLPQIATSIIVIFLLLYSVRAIQSYVLARPTPINQFSETDNSATPLGGDSSNEPNDSASSEPIDSNAVTPFPALAETPPITSLATSTSNVETMTPFGPEGQYVFHEVQPRESLALIASIHKTSIEVLEMINIFPQGSSLWVGQMVLVMPHQMELSGLSRFQIIRLQIRTRVVEISERYGIPVTELQLLNSLDPQEWLPAGRWLIIPYSVESD